MEDKKTQSLSREDRPTSIHNTCLIYTYQTSVMNGDCKLQVQNQEPNPVLVTQRSLFGGDNRKLARQKERKEGKECSIEESMRYMRI